jgi:hypothetical protein
MATDRYLRFVLTVIAACLVYLCIVLTPIPRAYAQDRLRPTPVSNPQDVYIVGYKYEVTSGVYTKMLTDKGLPVVQTR